MMYIAADSSIANFAVESLKQINRTVATPAGEHEEANVVVAAQFAIDAPGGQQVPRYIFNQSSGGSLGDSFAEYLKAPDNMTEQQALISFLKWVYCNPKCNEADRYALILWGHGPEFLVQPPAGDPKNDRSELYLSPEELREALDECIPKDNKLGFIGFDACSMSMFEMAYEIREYADYMVASQEEVPDLSFPYDSLIPLLRRFGGRPEALIREGIHAYVDAYQDYVCNLSTGMKRATLSALRLCRCNDLKNAIERLAVTLLEAKKDPGMPSLLVQSRSCSQDYAGGLYVDLVDFSIKLIKQLSIGKAVHVVDAYTSSSSDMQSTQVAQRMRKHHIIVACRNVIKALQEDTHQDNPDLLLLANSSVDPDNHGVSLYFPFFCDAQKQVANQPAVKGGIGTHGGKEFGAVLNNANAGLLMCARRQMIVDTESYYRDLALAKETGWYRFIVEEWSLILAMTAPDDLDTLYSAQQCAVNLSRACLPAGQPYPPKGCP